MKISLLGFPVLVMVAALTAACGNADQNTSNNGGNGGDGASSQGGSGAGTSATGGGDTGGGGQGGASTGGGNTGGNGGNTGGAGGGNTGGAGGGNTGPCGGKMGMPCADSHYCDYPDDLCGAADGAGTCTPKPEGCTDIYAPVCACDGTVHSNVCDAASAGYDISLLGTCPAPEGLFPCGTAFCVKEQQYCQVQVSDVGGVANTYSCLELPGACTLNGATCACLSDVNCGQNCTQENGGFTLTCPGG